jgi:hypothetical protein
MALIVGTADHRRRIHGHKQRALICRIPHGDTALPIPPAGHPAKISYLRLSQLRGAPGPKRVGLRHAACGMAERAMASVSRKRDRGVIRQRTAERPAARPNTAPTSALPVLSSASSAGCNTSSGCLVGTDAPRSMKPSSHSAADEAGSRTDHWQEAGSRRESMSAAFGGTAAIETRQPCRGHASYSSAVFVCPDSCY